jgi:S-adenosylmethionine decarboxylase
MKRLITQDKLRLDGFNNLTKALSFNLYDFCAGRDEAERRAYTRYIAEKFNAGRITSVLRGICDIIQAQVIGISEQDYDPWGASSMVLMSDIKGGGPTSAARMHLDKSHICAHTYPDFANAGTICSFRIDIDIATCGEISPLTALNYMFDHFESDVVVIDYVVRGFTRDTAGKRIYIDHDMRSVQDFIDPKILADYHCVDLALQSENIWQTKMLRTNLNESTYFLGDVDTKLPENQEFLNAIKREMRGIVHMWPD